MVPLLAVFGGGYARVAKCSWVNEIEYIGVTAIAFLVTLYVLVIGPLLRGERLISATKYIFLALIGVVMFATAPVADKVF